MDVARHYIDNDHGFVRLSVLCLPCDRTPSMRSLSTGYIWSYIGSLRGAMVASMLTDFFALSTVTPGAICSSAACRRCEG